MFRLIRCYCILSSYVSTQNVEQPQLNQGKSTSLEEGPGTDYSKHYENPDKTTVQT